MKRFDGASVSDPGSGTRSARSPKRSEIPDASVSPAGRRTAEPP